MSAKRRQERSPQVSHPQISQHKEMTGSAMILCPQQNQARAQHPDPKPVLLWCHLNCISFLILYTFFHKEHSKPQERWGGVVLTHLCLCGELPFPAYCVVLSHCFCALGAALGPGRVLCRRRMRVRGFSPGPDSKLTQ